MTIRTNQGEYNSRQCPFCKSKATTMFVEQDGTYFCMACGASGRANPKAEHGAISEEAASLLAFNTAANKIFRKTLLSQTGRRAHEYLIRRKLTEATVNRFSLGYVPPNLEKQLRTLGFDNDVMLSSGLFKENEDGSLWCALKNRVTFPIMDTAGSIVGFGGRVMDKSEPKYKNSPETAAYSKRKILYGWNRALHSRKDYVILCEGYMDVITLHQAGFTNAVASLGTALTREQVRLLKKKVRKVVLLYDTDTAGRNATARGIGLLRQAGFSILIANTEPCKDPDEFIQKFGISKFTEKLRTAQTDLQYRVENARKEDGTIDTEMLLQIALDGYDPVQFAAEINKLAK